MPSNRCQQCKKKLGLLPYQCKCGGSFCITHLPGEEHKCTYDYKAEQQERLRKAIDIGPLGSKLEKI